MVDCRSVSSVDVERVAVDPEGDGCTGVRNGSGRGRHEPVD